MVTKDEGLPVRDGELGVEEGELGAEDGALGVEDPGLGMSTITDDVGFVTNGVVEEGLAAVLVTCRSRASTFELATPADDL